jgi:hypothetical protein
LHGLSVCLSVCPICKWSQSSASASSCSWSRWWCSSSARTNFVKTYLVRWLDWPPFQEKLWSKQQIHLRSFWGRFKVPKSISGYIVSGRRLSRLLKLDEKKMDEKVTETKRHTLFLFLSLK